MQSLPRVMKRSGRARGSWRRSTGTPPTCRATMKNVEDYNELERMEVIEGQEILVLYSMLIYKVIGGAWKLVGKVTAEGKVVYRR